MGHTLGVDEHYFSRDPEYHRKVYEEKAMPNLTIESETPTETAKIVAKQADEIRKLKDQLVEFQAFKSRMAAKEQSLENVLKRLEALERKF